jgi:hypothetical protein
MFEGLKFLLTSGVRENVFKKQIPSKGGCLNGHKAPPLMFRSSVAGKKVLGADVADG